MRALISADLEGVAGVVHPQETAPGSAEYERARVWMTGEVNAVIAGIFDACPDAAVRVADAHGPFRNLLVDDLDPRAVLLRGKPRDLNMMAGIEDGADAVYFVGYHGRAGTGPAVLSHTISGGVHDVRINGVSHGETGLNTLLAGHFGASVVLCAGDDVACGEFTELKTGGVAVPVKRSLGAFAAETVHPAVARERLREAAARATGAPVAVDGPVELEMDLSGHAVDRATLIPGVRRDGMTVHFGARDYAEAYRMVLLLAALTLIPA